MTDGSKGLSAAEVQKRIACGQVNVDVEVKTRSIRQIVLGNVCTLFNAVNLILALFVFLTGSYKNALFMIVIVCNTAIGIVQEIRSKLITDRLSIVAGSHASIIRDAKRVELPLHEIVRDDVIVLGRGDQIPADSVVLSGSAEVNESLLTGESTLIKKEPGCELMSGSFVNAGTVRACVVHVGSENYAAQISAQAKQETKMHSEIMETLNGVIKFVSCLIFPVGALLFARQFFTGDKVDLNNSILSTVAALVGMIPEGLILLTSTVLAVAVVRLAKSKVLVQQLYCIETLARVDTLCLDKTGTITTGAMEVACVKPLDGVKESQVEQALVSLVASDEDPNETASALVRHYHFALAHALKPERIVPFSSDRKWSGATFGEAGSYVMGAGRFIMGDDFDTLEAQASSFDTTARVLLLACVEGFTKDEEIKGNPIPLAFIVIHDQIRSTAAQTIAYFKEQGVCVKVISGDDARTVAGIAKEVGVPNAHSFVDATTLKTPEQVAQAIDRYQVFGRVKPEQKKQFVLALQKQGHVVAMTGDGVNDTLALKQADCSVAMAAGSDAARNVAQLVLVDNDFASMPKVVAEGRRSINNLQRSASLFLAKTLFSMCLAVAFVLLPWQYPFQPIQMTLISSFTIGIPSFVLALEPNKDRIQGHFLENVLVKSVPGGLTAVLIVVMMNVAGHVLLGLNYAQISTLCVLLTAWVGLMLIIKLSLPFTPVRVVLLGVVILGTVTAATSLHTTFGFQPFTIGMTLIYLIFAVIIVLVFHWLYGLCERWYARRCKAEIK